MGVYANKMDTLESTDTPIIEVRGVCKTFGGVVHALDDVTIAIRRNEIVGVVGENGAGKSTLMKILVGVYPPDRGEFLHRGKRLPFPKDPKEAARRGISIVYQEKGVIPRLKVYQFLLLGREDLYSKASILQIDRMKKTAGAILEELHVACGVDDYLYDIPLATQKMVEIARAILSVRLERGDPDAPSIVILDEPTAPLTMEERRELFGSIVKTKTNASFVFVSHIIPEVMEFTDRIHVLRDGRLVAHYDLSRGAVTEEDLFRAIVGRESSQSIGRPQPGKAAGGEVVLTARSLTKKGSYYDISFELRRGECIGIFGPAGSGKSEILNTIAGTIDFEGGDLTVKGRKAQGNEPPHVRLERGIGYFSGETGKELFLNWPIAKNISIVNMKKIVSKPIPVIRFGAERKMAERIMEKLRIKAPSARTDCYSLSGGNKQKVSVGKWLERSPDILLLEDPTIGIDVGARNDIYETAREMKDRGISMILASDDPREYSSLCDRILYLKNGRIQRILDPREYGEVLAK